MITVTNQGVNEVVLQGPGSGQPTVCNRGWPLLSHAFDDHTFFPDLPWSLQAALSLSQQIAGRCTRFDSAALKRETEGQL